MPFDHSTLEAMEEANAARRKEWEFRATIYVDLHLKPDTWAVDGEVQEAPLTEDNLFKAVNGKAPAKPMVTVAPPLHLVIGRIIGFSPPYRHVMEEAA